MLGSGASREVAPGRPPVFTRRRWWVTSSFPRCCIVAGWVRLVETTSFSACRAQAAAYRARTGTGDAPNWHKVYPDRGPRPDWHRACPDRRRSCRLLREISQWMAFNCRLPFLPDLPGRVDLGLHGTGVQPRRNRSTGRAHAGGGSPQGSLVLRFLPLDLGSPLRSNGSQYLVVLVVVVVSEYIGRLAPLGLIQFIHPAPWVSARSDGISSLSGRWSPCDRQSESTPPAACPLPEP